MKTLSELRNDLAELKSYLAEKYGVTVIGVFGSYVRNEQRSNSDLDILIELSEPPMISLIGLIELEEELSDRLGVKVDLAVKKNLKKGLGLIFLVRSSPYE